MTSMKVIQFVRLPTPLFINFQTSSTPIDLGRAISNEPPPALVMITNQLKENIIQG